MPEFMSMFLAFGGDKVGKTKEGNKAFVRTKVITPSKKPAKPVEPSKRAATPPATPAIPPPAPTPPPVIPPTPTTPSAPAWSESEDATLTSMKASNKTWKEIEEALPGKDRSVLKDRFRQLQAAKGEAGKDTAVKDDAASTKSKESQESGKGEEGERRSARKTPSPSPGAKKKVEKLPDEPTIYLEHGGELDALQMGQLHKLHAKAEREKWIEVSSRFFDKTGKRIEPGVLREKLGGLA